MKLFIARSELHLPENTANAKINQKDTGVSSPVQEASARAELRQEFSSNVTLSEAKGLRSTTLDPSLTLRMTENPIRAELRQSAKEILQKNPNDFNANGIALTDNGKRIALSLYQRALNEFVKRLSQITTVNGQPVQLKAGVLFGSLAEEGLHEARFGIFPPSISYEDAEKIAIPRSLGNEPNQKRNWPSDIDLQIDYGVFAISGPAIKIHSAIEPVAQAIYDDMGIIIHYAPVLPSRARNLIAIEDIVPDGFMKLFIARSDLRLPRAAASTVQEDAPAARPSEPPPALSAPGTDQVALASLALSDLRKAGSTNAISPSHLLNLDRDVIFVIEQSEIDALSPEMFEELLELAGLNKTKLHLVIPDALKGKYSARVAELRKVASVDYGVPEIAKDPTVPVVGFSDMERDTIEKFQERLDPRLALRIASSAFGLNQPGAFGIGLLYALKDISVDQLSINQNGFRYDAVGRWCAWAVKTLQAYVVVSTSA